MEPMTDITCKNEECQLARKIMLANQESLKQKVATLTEEIKELRRNSVSIQQQAGQEEKIMSNTLQKRIQRSKQEKESSAINCEQEGISLTKKLVLSSFKYANNEPVVSHPTSFKKGTGWLTEELDKLKEAEDENDDIEWSGDEAELSREISILEQSISSKREHSPAKSSRKRSK